jgi:hypothetical protein
MVSSTGSYLGQSSRSDKTARMTVDRSFQQFTMKILTGRFTYEVTVQSLVSDDLQPLAQRSRKNISVAWLLSL